MRIPGFAAPDVEAQRRMDAQLRNQAMQDQQRAQLQLQQQQPLVMEHGGLVYQDQAGAGWQ